MTGRKKLAATELLEAVEESDATDEAERIRTMSDEAIDRDLAHDGFDPVALRARGRALAGERRGRSPRVRSKGVALLAAAAVALLVLTPAIERRTVSARLGPVPIEREPIVQKLPPLPTPTPTQVAAKLRDEAFTACDRSEWDRCEERLNAARALDPSGEAGPRVQQARRDVAVQREAARPSSDEKR